MRLAWSVLVFLMLAPTASGQTTAPDLPPLPEATALPDDVAAEELAIVVRPLDAEELAPVVEDWRGRLRDKVEQTSRVRRAALLADDADERADLRRRVAELELDRGKLADRVELLLDAYDDRGGEAGEARAYVAAVTDAGLDPGDFGVLAEKARAWAVDPDGGVAVVLNILYFLVILIFAFILAKILRRLTLRALGRVSKASVLLRTFLAGLVSKVVMLVGFIVAISFLGVNIGPLVAAIGAAGLVVGLALQGTLSNFASGILILLYRPYDVGDVISAAGGVGGKVEAMTLVSTTIVTFDNQRIVVPNNNIWGETITNLTGLPTRRVDMTFGVGYGDDLDRVMAVLEQVCRDHPLVLSDPPPLIKVVSHGDSSVGVTCRPWARTGDYWTVHWDFQKLVKQAFDREGITIPFPQRDVHLRRAG